MLQEGANVFRINFSHADYEDVKERVQMIRELNEEFGYNASILADLQGPKLRVGVMKGEVIVSPEDEIIFATGERFEGTNPQAPIIETLNTSSEFSDSFTYLRNGQNKFNSNETQQNFYPFAQFTVYSTFGRNCTKRNCKVACIG